MLDLITAILSWAAYSLAVVVSLRGLSVDSFRPSTAYCLGVVSLAPPTYTFSIEGGIYNSELFEASATTVHALVVFGLYGSVFAVKLLASRYRHLENFQEFMVPWSKGKTLLLTVSIVAAWVFLTPRFKMLETLLSGIMLGDSVELNYARRIEFASGFFNTKVFTWIRFSLSPLLLLYLLSAFRNSKPWSRIAVSFLGYCLYFAMSASFHKSTWFLGVIYIGLFHILTSRSLQNLGAISVYKSAGVLIVSLVSVVGLVTLSYLVQYRSNDSLTLWYHFVGAMDRVCGAVTFGYGAFAAVFPEIIPFSWDGGGVSSLDESPERAVALALGVDTTIQPGVLGGLYAAIGLLAMPVYVIYALCACFVCDIAVAKSGIRAVVVNVVLCVNILWILQMPPGSSIASSGILLTVITGCIAGWNGART